MSGTDKPNQYDGPCWRCGTTVPAKTGTYNRERHGSEHPEGACKTTTTTWQRTQDELHLAEFRAATAALYADAGYTVIPGHGFEGADQVSGHGLTALVGGSARDKIEEYGVRIYRDGNYLGEWPRPRLNVLVSKDEYYERCLDVTRALIALIDSHKAA